MTLRDPQALYAKCLQGQRSNVEFWEQLKTSALNWDVVGIQESSVAPPGVTVSYQKLSKKRTMHENYFIAEHI